MKTPFLIATLLVVCFCDVIAQERTLPYSNLNLLNINPSFAGSNERCRLQTVYQNQYPKLPRRVVTYGVHFDTYIKPLRGGLGISAQVNDWHQGLLKNTYLALTYAPHISCLSSRQLKIIPSLQVAYFQRKLNLSSLAYNEPFDPEWGRAWVWGIPLSQKSNTDFTAGLLANYKTFYGGLSLKHFLQPDVALLGTYKLPYQLIGHASYSWVFDNKNLLQYGGLFSQQGDVRNFRMTINALMFGWLTAGLGYDNDKNLYSTVGFRLNNVSANMGYHLNTNKLAGNTAGIYTFALGFSLGNKRVNAGEIRTFENW